MGAKQEFSSAAHAAATGFECKRRNLKKQITLKVNGVKREILVSPNELLLNVLRDQLGLTGAKYGYGIGECGSCTVLVDGEPVLSCLTLAIGLDGSDVLTVEGLMKPDGSLHPIQESFLEHGAVQCGFCTPGMVVWGKPLLVKTQKLSKKKIVNIFREIFAGATD